MNHTKIARRLMDKKERIKLIAIVDSLANHKVLEHVFMGNYRLDQIAMMIEATDKDFKK